MRDDFVPPIPNMPAVGIGVCLDHRKRRTDIVRVQLQLPERLNRVYPLHQRVRLYLVAPTRNPCSRFNAASVS